jgi:FKBP-type peptidyl-prolyl cis-trans isomerase SlyD
MKISNQKLVSMTYSIHEGTNLLENVDTPVSFVYGKETNLLPIVEKSLVGKEKGNELTIEVSPEFGFGDIDKNLIFIDSTDNVPKEYSKIGMQIDFENDKGLKRKFRVTNIDKDKITFDGNHPFSGKTLIYKIKIIDVTNTEAVKD